MENKRIYNYQEVYDSAKRTGMNDSPGQADFGRFFTKNTKFSLVAVPIWKLRYKSWTPDKIMNGEPPKYDENGILIGGDEFHAHRYAKTWNSSDSGEPVIATRDFHLADGRHRARAAFIRGETHIMAYVELDE